MSELKILQGKARAIIIPIFILILGCASSTIGVFEEAFPSIPIFVRIASAMGYDTVVGIAVIVWGVKVKGWYFEDLSAVFLIMGIVSSLIMGWRPNTIAEKMAASFTDIAVACMIIGFSRGILVVLQSGHIIDTIVYGISIPLHYFPSWVASEAMLVVQTLLNFLIPSGSGQAVTSMPIMAPLADLVGVSRQVSVLAFQFGDGLSNIVWPTAMAPIMCGIAGVKIEKWWKFIVPIFLVLLLTQGILIGISTIVF